MLGGGGVEGSARDKRRNGGPARPVGSGSADSRRTGRRPSSATGPAGTTGEKDAAGARQGRRRRKKSAIVVNVSACKYEAVRWAARQFGWQVSSDEEGTDWNIYWTDTSVAPQRLTKMRDYQKINHFPGMLGIARKGSLARRIRQMREVFPQEFSFTPETWTLPGDWTDFKRQFRLARGTKSKTTFIVKPDASCQGKGIFLTRSLAQVDMREPQVAQKYLTKPLLIDGHKFDLRVYVLVTSCLPLRVFLYREGLCRLATTQYKEPKAKNLARSTMHLTNYAINRGSSSFVHNTDAGDDGTGSKRSLRWFFSWLKEEGKSADGAWHAIAHVCCKTLVSIQPELAHHYRSCTSNENDGSSCFEILGLDIMFDRRMRPWVIEVNHSPSFSLSSPLDKSIKRALLSDTMALLNVSATDKRRARARDAAAAKSRLLGRPLARSSASAARDRLRTDVRRRRNEEQNAGNFLRIFPPPASAPWDEAYYAPMLEAATLLFVQTPGTAHLGSASDPVLAAALRAAADELSRRRQATLQQRQSQLGAYAGYGNAIRGGSHAALSDGDRPDSSGCEDEEEGEDEEEDEEVEVEVDRSASRRRSRAATQTRMLSRRSPPSPSSVPDPSPGRAAAENGGAGAVTHGRRRCRVDHSPVALSDSPRKEQRGEGGQHMYTSARRGEAFQAARDRIAHATRALVSQRGGVEEAGEAGEARRARRQRSRAQQPHQRPPVGRQRDRSRVWPAAENAAPAVSTRRAADEQDQVATARPRSRPRARSANPTRPSSARSGTGAHAAAAVPVETGPEGDPGSAIAAAAAAGTSVAPSARVLALASPAGARRRSHGAGQRVPQPAAGWEAPEPRASHPFHPPPSPTAPTSPETRRLARAGRRHMVDWGAPSRESESGHSGGGVIHLATASSSARSSAGPGASATGFEAGSHGSAEGGGWASKDAVALRGPPSARASLGPWLEGRRRGGDVAFGYDSGPSRGAQRGGEAAAPGHALTVGSLLSVTPLAAQSTRNWAGPGRTALDGQRTTGHTLQGSILPKGGMRVRPWSGAGKGGVRWAARNGGDGGTTAGPGGTDAPAAHTGRREG